jgi:hypothetical protein
VFSWLAAGISPGPHSSSPFCHLGPGSFGSAVAFSFASLETPRRFVATEKRNINMTTQPFHNGDVSRTATRKHQLLSLFIALLFAFTIYPATVRAQIEGELEVNIPFQFHAGNAKLPAGAYRIHMLPDSDLTVMEITSADGTTSALLEVQQADANSTPAKGELIFNKYGDRYFLAKVFDAGNPSGSALTESRYEKRLNQATAERQAHVPARHRGQQGN